jgi:DNA-directed RNA polymerase subunit H (RpoH/RPB5)
MEIHIVNTEEELRMVGRDIAGNNDLTRLPAITSDDPMALYFGLRPNTVIKEICDSSTAGKLVNYRVVIRSKPKQK